jgi:nucleotide-binding universal stress UspA family protein
MAITVDQHPQGDRARRRPEREVSADAMRALRVLAVVDGSEGTGRVMKYVCSLRTFGLQLEVVLLNVQAAPEDWRLRGYGWFKRDEIRNRLVEDLARPVVESAVRQLNRADIPHKSRIELGDTSETILRCAKEEESDLIVLAETPPRLVRRWLLRTASISLGSIASVVIALSDSPVVVAK